MNTIRQDLLEQVGDTLGGIEGVQGVTYGYPSALHPATKKTPPHVWYWDVDQDYDSATYRASMRLLAELHVGVMMSFTYTEEAPNAEGNNRIPQIIEAMNSDETWGGIAFHTEVMSDEITELATDNRTKLGAAWMGWAISYFVQRAHPHAQ